MSSEGGRLLVISAPSGAGKTSLVRALVDGDPELVLSVSHTTRAPRPGERDGEHYHFVSAARFAEMVAAGAFLEHAEVFGHRYGTARAGVLAELERGRDVLLEIDWQGARQVRERMPEALAVFILPPSREALAERLRARAQDSESVIERRLAAARREIEHYREFDYLVVNERFEEALADLQAIVRAERLRLPRQRDRHAALLAALLE